MPSSSVLPKDEYRRRMPHNQTSDRPIFITFRKLTQSPFSWQARSAILQHCLRDGGKKYELHAAVVMPDHLHLLLTPLRDGNGGPSRVTEILKLIQGVSARSVNRLLNTAGPVWQDEWFDHVLRSEESQAEKCEYIRQNPVRKGLVTKAEDYPWLWMEKK